MSDFIPPYPTPLKKLPGPIELLKLARSDLLSIWPETAYERQYMNFKLINRTLVIANHPEIVRHTLLDKAGNYQKKSSLLKKLLTPLLGDSLFISDGDPWQGQRELGESVMTAPTTADYGDVIEDISQAWGQKWCSSVNNELTVLPEMKQLAATVYCHILFGRSVSPEQVSRLTQRLSDYMALIEQLDFNALFGLPSWFAGKKSAKSAQLVKSIHDLVDQIIAENLTGENQASLLSRYIQFSEKSPANLQLSRDQIRNNLIGMLMMGCEATANTLAWLWYLLSQSPGVERKLHEELDQLGNHCTTLRDWDQLTYTVAVIKETLRLYPPLPLLIRESAEADMIRNRPVPAGSFLFVVPWLLHRHRKYWDKPNHFLPERFLAAAPKPEPLSFIPFGVGPRACLAETMALQVTALCLANLAQRFRLQAGNDCQIMPVSRLMLRPDGSMPMRLLARA